jgi:glutamyl-tRNA synthetase
MLEMADGAVFYFTPPEKYDQSALEKFTPDHLRTLFSLLLDRLATSSAATAADFDALFKDICAENGWKMPQVGQPVRIALSGGTQAPGIGEIVSTLGTTESCRRIERIVRTIA